MRVGPVRVVLVVASLYWLAGCNTTGTGTVAENSQTGETEGGAQDATGSIAGGPPAETLVVPNQTPASTGLLGDDPKDNLNLGKRYYRENQFGLAEQHFRRAVEQSPKDLESWIGLAAAYDKLRRFDLADRAYAQAIGLAGPTAEILNNQGYSYLLRGDRRKAREKLLAAYAKEPGNPYVKNNLDLLDESIVEKRGAR